MNRLIRKIYLPILVWRASLRLRYASARADKAHALTGERWYVMPDEQERLIIMQRENMRTLRRLGRMDPKVRVSDLLRECFYCTPDRSGTPLPPGVIEAKRTMYLRYVLHTRSFRL